MPRRKVVRSERKWTLFGTTTLNLLCKSLKTSQIYPASFQLLLPSKEMQKGGVDELNTKPLTVDYTSRDSFHTATPGSFNLNVRTGTECAIGEHMKLKKVEKYHLDSLAQAFIRSLDSTGDAAAECLEHLEIELAL